MVWFYASVNNIKYGYASDLELNFFLYFKCKLYVFVTPFLFSTVDKCITKYMFIRYLRYIYINI